MAAAVAAVWTFGVGAVMVARDGYGLGRFGGFGYIPLAVTLEISRVWAAWGASMAVVLVVTGILHPGVTPPGGRLAILSALAVPIAYAPVTAISLAGAGALGSAWLALPLRAFLDPIKSEDLWYGARSALVLGAVPVAWVFLGRPVWGSRLGLAAKLVVVFCSLSVVAILYRLLAG